MVKPNGNCAHTLKIAQANRMLSLFLLVSCLHGATVALAEPAGVLDYMERVAVSEDCYFTLEESWDEVAKLANPISSQIVDWPSQRKSLNDHLKYLGEKLPYFSVLPESSAPCVLHVVDKRLLKLEKYAMDAPLSNFEYSGNLHGLLLQIHKMIPNVGPPRGGSFGLGSGVMGHIDQLTKITVHQASKTKVRDAITRFLPLAGYNRILWFANTHVISVPPDTEVYMQGPRRAYWATEASLNVGMDVSSGETSLESYLQLRRAEAQHTVRFMKAQGTSGGRSSQLRWAIRLLGEMRAPEGVPVLLDFIHWQYSPWGILEESYPAVYALSKIGKPAVNEILKQLAKEEDVLRRGLMCEVLRKVEGNKQAIRLVEDVLGETQAAEEKKNVEAALKSLRTEVPIIDPLLPKERYSMPKEQK